MGNMMDNPVFVLVKARPTADDRNRLVLHQPCFVTDSNDFARCDLYGFPVSFGTDATQVVKSWAEANGYDVHDASTRWWKVIVTTAPGEAWVTNAKVYETWRDAQGWLYDLTSRWYAVKHGAIRPATEDEIETWAEWHPGIITTELVTGKAQKVGK
jgi:hypothetical protein